MLKSILACAAVLGALALIGCGGNGGGGIGGNGDNGGDPKPSFLRLSAIGNEAGDAHEFWARTSSGDAQPNAPVRIVIEPGTMQVTDGFYLGKRGDWMLWIPSGNYSNDSATYDDVNDELTIDENEGALYRLYNADGSIKKTYDGGRIHLVLGKDLNVIKSLEFTPEATDADTPGKVTLATEDPLEDTIIQFDLGGPF